MYKQLNIFDFIEKPYEPEEVKSSRTLFDRIFAKINDPMIQCANCLCERCVNNVENLWSKVKPEEVKESCFNCDECYHYDGSLKHKPRQKEDCEKFEISEYAATNKRRKMKIVINGSSRKSG